MKAESEKRGLGSSIDIKLCRLEKSAERSRAYTINNDDNEDEMTFLQAVATRSGSKGKSNDVPFEYYISVCISHHHFTFAYISFYVYLTSVISLRQLCGRHKNQKIDSTIKNVN